MSRHGFGAHSEPFGATAQGELRWATEEIVRNCIPLVICRATFA